MATKNQDVELGVKVNVTNAERVQALGQELKELARDGALSAAEFQKLSTELKELTAQSAAVVGLEKIESELTQVSTALGIAREKADAFGTKLAEQTAKTSAFREAQQLAVKTLNESKLELIDLNEALDLHRVSTDRAGKNAADYREKQTALAQAIALTEAAVARERLELDAANKALSTADSELKKLTKASNDAANAADKLAASEREQSQALNLAKEAVTALGISSTSAATAQEHLAASLDLVNKQTAEAQAAAERLAAIQKYVAESNARNVELAQKAAATRAAADTLAQQRAEALAVAMNKLGYANDAVAASEARVEAEAVAAGAAIQQAFGVAGVRSSNQIQAEIAETQNALALLRQSGALTGAALDDAMKRAAARVAELNVELRAVTNQSTFGDKFKAGFGALADGANAIIARFGAMGAAIAAVVFAFKPFFDTIIQLDSMRRALTAVTGSVAEAEKAIAFLRETANKSGVAIGSIADAFVRFVASARSSGISMQVVRDVFSATAQAAGNLGLGSEKLTHILDALGQMANKGVVSMEELRQQLGDSLPGALGLLAKGLGITEQQLVKLVETGQLLTIDALPALANALTTLGAQDGQVKGIAASFNILKNSITQTTQIAADSKGFNLLLETLKIVGIAVSGLYTGFLQMVEGIGMLVSSVVGAGKAILSFSTGPLKQAGVEISASATRIQNLSANFVAMTDAMNGTATAATSSGTAIEQTGQQAQTAATGHAANAQAQSTSATAATSNAQGQAASGAATAAAGVQAQGAVGQWYALQIAFAELEKRREKEIENAEVYAKAAAIEGKTRQQLAQIAGDEGQAIKLAADASQLEAEKLAIVSALRNADVAEIQRQKAALEALSVELGDPTGNRKKQIDALNEIIKARTAEAEKAVQTAEAMRLEALARDTAAKSYADNSAKLNTLRNTYEQTVKAVQALEAAYRVGMATAGQVDAARERSVVAEALYRDAVKDSAAAVDRKTRSIEAGLAIDKSSIELAKAKIDTDILIRQSLNDTSAIYLLQIEKKKLDLQATRDTIAAKQTEIALSKQQLDIDLQAIKANDPLRSQKLQEIELRKQGITLRETELARDKELAAQTQRQIQLAQQRGATSLNSSISAVEGIEREIAATERLNAAKEKSIELENKRRNVDANGFSLDKTGKSTVNEEVPTWMSIVSQLKSYGLDDAAAQNVAREFTDSNGNVQYANNPGQIKYGGNGGSMSFAIQQAASKYLQNQVGIVQPAPKPTSAPAQTPSSASSSSGGARYSVDVNLAGATTTINTASDADARNLVNLMTQLSSRTA